MNSSPQEIPSSRLHLRFLDGIRGVAALYVCLHHAAMILLATLANVYPGSTPKPLLTLCQQIFYAFLAHGHSAVVVFIVLSGFCLMLPVARAGREAAFNTPRFFGRRSRRILPPYYAALALSLLICAIPGLNRPTGFANDLQLPAFTIGAIGTHLLLIHNLFPAFAAKINAPLWSVALEWQIYFVFALLLIPLWRRYGALTALTVSFALGVLPHELTPTGSPVVWSNAWLLTAFGIGMAAAALCFGGGARATQWRERRFWMPAATALGLAVAAFLLIQRESFATHPILRFTQMRVLGQGWILDLIVAVWASLLIIACVQWLRQREASDRSPLALRLFDSAPAVALGSFSYSLYLIHSPLLLLGDLFVRRFVTTGSLAVCAYLLLVIPFALTGAYLLYYMVERHCLNTPTPKTR